jgi:glucose-6-phosphate 1-epimerase
MEFDFGIHSLIVQQLGATITSWKVNGSEVLFLSQHAIFNGTKAIRGGIPIVFPAFGPHEGIPGQHGFARNLNWRLKRIQEHQEIVDICFQLHENLETLAWWPYKFSLNFHIRIPRQEPSMDCRLEVINTGEEPFAFQALLLNYFAVDSILQTQLAADFSTFQDKITGHEVKECHTMFLGFHGAVDRIYPHLQGPVRVIQKAQPENKGLSREYLIESTFEDVVIWNPWQEGAVKMNDFGNEEYLRMIYVEPGTVSKQQILRPGELWQREQKISLVQNYL